MIRGRQFNRTGRYKLPPSSRTMDIPSPPPTAQPAPLPIPTGGWNTNSPLTGAPPDSAAIFDNFFPQPAYVELRRGFMAWCNTATGTVVESLIPYSGVTTGSDGLFAATGGKIFDVTTATPSAVVTALSNNRWQYVQFATSGGTFLVLANGVDAVRNYNGTVWSTPTITGVSSNSLIDVTSHLNRLWFVESGTANAWYLPSGAIAGKASPFPLGGLFKLGGFLVTIASWKIDGEGGSDDLLAFVSSRGEVIVYGGTDPTNAATWQRQGNYLLGPPIGRRPIFQLGGDLAMISLDGVLPLSQALLVERSAAVRVSLTANIQPTMASSARLYKDNFGWQLISYPRGTRAILNVPAVQGVSQQQYVMNTVTGAWCRFLKHNANCWAVWKDRLFFGGNDGRVMEADVGGSDDGTAIDGDLQTAFHDLGGRGTVKHFSMVRPIFTSSSSLSPGIGLNIDYELNADVSAPSPATTAAAMWDVAVWDVDSWPVETLLIKDWQSVAAKPGNAVSVRLKVSSLLTGSSEPILQLNALDVLWQPGGLI